MGRPARSEELSPREKRQLLARRLREKAAQPKQYPLSFGQERLWFLEQLQPGMSVYNLATSMSFADEVDPIHLQACIDELLRRHEVLRTTFGSVAGRPVQIVAADYKVMLAVTDLRAAPAVTCSTEVQHWALREAQLAFDVAEGPLIRFRLLRLPAGTSLLLFALHHIVADGWSLSILTRELSLLYGAFAAGRPSPLQPLPMQFGDYAAWQRQWLQGERLAQQLSYWRRQLDGAPAVAELPADRTRLPVQSFRGAWRSFSIAPETCQALRLLGQRTGSTLYMVLLAAFQVLLMRYTGQQDCVVGTPIANRPQRRHEELIGLFANALVIRTDLSGNPRFIDLLNRVRRVTLDAYGHQDLPFERLVEELQPVRHLSHHPLFQVMFALSEHANIRHGRS
jgi:hypothetical protein